ncbi:diacylglycerol kinase [Desulfurobacterium atlanticum]|uniref:Undecaprenol kinase/diacylglycerol kinase (ATP) n=1 Tax=Desulfurobacterium atlanticum TaxID=240169 RepID=A0A238Z7K8_9BACT|nr:diacylglycerol kinase [Desulfurobacterium atlanticum]SNR79122.1 undecaprenol kinase/diacylglycerol kinase (ATP) [Desulfurobacterium atlanticum]
MKRFLIRILKALRYAVEGLVAALKIDLHFRINFFLWLSLALLSLLLLQKNKLLIFTINYFVIIVELINTSIEKAVDTATVEWKLTAKYAKDIACAATLFAGGFAGVVDTIYLLPELLKLLK